MSDLLLFANVNAKRWCISLGIGDTSGSSGERNGLRERSMFRKKQANYVRILPFNSIWKTASVPDKRVLKRTPLKGILKRVLAFFQFIPGLYSIYAQRSQTFRLLVLRKLYINKSACHLSGGTIILIFFINRIF